MDIFDLKFLIDWQNNDLQSSQLSSYKWCVWVQIEVNSVCVTAQRHHQGCGGQNTNRWTQSLDPLFCSAYLTEGDLQLKQLKHCPLLFIHREKMHKHVKQKCKLEHKEMLTWDTVSSSFSVCWRKAHWKLSLCQALPLTGSDPWLSPALHSKCL